MSTATNRKPLLLVALSLTALAGGAFLWTVLAGRSHIVKPVDASAPRPQAPPNPEALAQPDSPAQRASDDERLATLDAADPSLSFETKYAGCEPRLLELARGRVEVRLDVRSDAILDALLAAGTTRKQRVPPGETVAPTEGSLARKSRAPWQPYGITELEIAEFDRAEHPETRRLWSELVWIDQHLRPR